MPDNEYSVELGLVLNDSSKSAIKEQIKSLGSDKVKIQFDLSNAKNQINTLKKEIQSLGKISFKLNGVGASADFNATTHQIDKMKLNYNELMTTIKKMGSIKVKLSGLDAEKDSRQISVLTKELNTLQAKIQNIQATYGSKWDAGQLMAIEEQFVKIGGSMDVLKAKMLDKTAEKGRVNSIKEVESAYKELLNLTKQMGTVSSKITMLDSTKDIQQINILERQLDELVQKYWSLQSTFQSQLSPEQFDKVSAEAIKAEQMLDVLKAKMVDTFNTKVANGGMDAEITSLEQKINALSNSSVGLRQKLAELRSIQASAGNNPSMEQSVSLQQRYNELIAQTNNQLKQEMIAQQELNAKQKQQQAYMKLLNDRSSLSNQMSIWLKNNSAAAKQFGSQIQTLQAELKSCDSTRLTGIKREFKEITQQAAIAGKNVMTMGDQLKKKASAVTSYFSGFMVVTYAIQGLRNMYDKVLDINTAMTELKKVTDDTNATYSQFLDNAAEEAGSVSATISDYIKTASDYARLGYNTNQASDLAKNALLYNNVGDEIENVDQATASLISTMKGFHIEAENSISIVDKFNNVGKVYCPVIQ